MSWKVKPNQLPHWGIPNPLAFPKDKLKPCILMIFTLCIWYPSFCTSPYSHISTLSTYHIFLVLYPFPLIIELVRYYCSYSISLPFWTCQVSLLLFPIPIIIQYIRFNFQATTASSTMQLSLLKYSHLKRSFIWYLIDFQHIYRSNMKTNKNFCWLS